MEIVPHPKAARGGFRRRAGLGREGFIPAENLFIINQLRKAQSEGISAEKGVYWKRPCSLSANRSIIRIHKGAPRCFVL